MRKPLSFILPILFTVLQIASAQTENVGIGTTTPNHRLDVQSNPSSTNLINLNSRVNYSGGIDIKAMEGYSVTAPGFGIGGRFTGGYKGLEAICSGGNYAGIALYGLYGQATGTAGQRIGVYGNASGGTSNYGLWGEVNGGANHYAIYGQNTNLAGYAGYFNGRGFFTQELRADKNLIVDDTAWTSRIWNQSGQMQIKSLTDLEFTIDRNNSATAGFF